MRSALYRWRWLLTTLFVWALFSVLTVWRYQLPPVQKDTAEGFSAARAMATLRRLLPTDAPHPRGSAEQAAVVQRLVQILKEAGLNPVIQNAHACSPLGPCGQVQNVSVTLPGNRDTLVLFSAHTDSTPHGPGAGDDGQGVAILVELARSLKDQPHENGFVFLFTDGEEDGLLGAMAFLEGDPAAARVLVNVNLEARGNTGLSTLFRTAGQDAWLIEQYARFAPAPFTSSVHQVVFETMPHYTDLSVWQSFGIPGVDFAFIDGADAYHSPHDTVDQLDPRSVQSQGENAQAMLLGLKDADLTHPPEGHAAWFDVLGLFVVRWPESWTLWFSLVPFGCALLFARRARRQGHVGIKTLTLGIAFTLGHLLGCLGIGALFAWGLPTSMGSFAGLTVLPVVGVWSIGLGLLLRRQSAHALQLGGALTMTLLAIPIALFVPGIAHLWVLPGLTMVLLWFFTIRRSSLAVPLSALGAFTAGAVIWLPLLEGTRIALAADSILPLSAGAGMLFVWTLSLWRSGDAS